MTVTVVQLASEPLENASEKPSFEIATGIQLSAILPNMLVGRNSTNRQAVVTGAAVKS